MKLFLKRDTIDEKSGFMIYDNKGLPKYSVTSEAGNGMKLALFDSVGQQHSLIRYNTLMLNYFTVRCEKRFYVLLPVMNKQFTFAIYGSTYRFTEVAGDQFCVTASDGSPVMTQKKCWCRYGDGYELEIIDEAHEILLLSIAVCADMYLTITEKLAPQAT